MGRIILSNNKSWVEILKKSQSIAGMRINSCMNAPGKMLCYYKYRIDNENFYLDSESEDYVATCGTLIYKNLFGKEALCSLLKDAKEKSIPLIRKDLMGNFFIVLRINGEVLAFTDEMGTYSVYYYEDDNTGDYIITNTFYHVQKCVNQKIRAYEYLENISIPSIFDEKSPFENIYRLKGNELFRIKEGLFLIETIGLNTYQLENKEFDSNVKQIGDAFLKYANLRKKIPYECTLFLTGGVDSRLLLASYIAEKTSFLLGNWQGAPVDMNTHIEDWEISKELSKRFGLTIVGYDVSHDIVSDLDVNYEETYERYGEYAAIYGNNRKWFEIFEKAENIHWDFGHLGEVFRDVEALESIFHENFSLYEFYHKFLRVQAADFNFESDGQYTKQGLDSAIYNKYLKYCEEEGINTNALTRNDCHRLHSIGMLHSDTLKGNMYNVDGFYTNIYSQKELFDYSISVNSEYKRNKRLILGLIDYIYPDLNSIQYYTRCHYMNYDDNNKCLVESRSSEIKTKVKSVLTKTSIGRDFFKNRYHQYEMKVYKNNKKYIDEYVLHLSKTNVLKSIGVTITGGTFTYLPHYGILFRSNQYMDRIM